ncbi:MAG: nitroreductase family protein, partial [Clostridium sp.]|nr:nitroreductase family protein [Clostridium sp.]
YIACANLMTIAAFEKIDSCPIGGFDLDAVNKILVKRNLLDEEKFYVTLMVALGYRKNPQPIKTRQPFKDIFVLVK